MIPKWEAGGYVKLGQRNLQRKFTCTRVRSEDCRRNAPWTRKKEFVMEVRWTFWFLENKLVLLFGCFGSCSVEMEGGEKSKWKNCVFSCHSARHSDWSRSVHSNHSIVWWQSVILIFVCRSSCIWKWPESNVLLVIHGSRCILLVTMQ